MQGVEGQIFNPMARTYGLALGGALIATFTVTPVLAALLLPEHIREAETIIVRTLRALYTPILRLPSGPADHRDDSCRLPVANGRRRTPPWHRVPPPSGRGQPLDSLPPCRRPFP